MRLMSINRLTCLRMYSLPGNKQKKKGAANESSLMFRNVSAIFKKSGEVEHAWKDELLVVVGYNLEVFAIVWRAHCKDMFVKGINDE
jgi:hypothetical protein